MSRPPTQAGSRPHSAFTVGVLVFLGDADIGGLAKPSIAKDDRPGLGLDLTGGTGSRRVHLQS